MAQPQGALLLDLEAVEEVALVVEAGQGVGNRETPELLLERAPRRDLLTDANRPDPLAVGVGEHADVEIGRAVC